MLRMDGFRLRRATTYAFAREMWTPETMYVAGGTDLLPNLKHRIFAPKELIDLSGIPGGIHNGETLRIDGATRLQDIADSALVRAKAPALAQAAGLVAGPQIRSMGTIGGNVLLDTRCLFYNQSEFWRKSLGYCLKAEGTWCHVVGGPKTCVATQSADTVPVLLAMDASVELLGASGHRVVAMRDLYRFNGMDHLVIDKGELLTAVLVPVRGGRASYTKIRTRDSIDFPQLGLAVWGEFAGGVATALEIVVGAVNPQPKPIRGLDALLGRPLDIDAVADLVYKQTRPQASTHGDVAWRRQMAAVTTRRALHALVESP